MRKLVIVRPNRCLSSPPEKQFLIRHLSSMRAVPAVVATVVFLFFGTPGWAVTSQAYLDSVTQVKNSFHWDHTEGGVAQVTTEARVLLAEKPSNLTTLHFDASNPARYSVREINGTLQNCVLLTTYTKKDAFWQSAVPQQDLQFHSGGGAGYDIFSWVTAGADLKNYVASNYTTSLSVGTVDLRISQTLGMPDSTGQGRVLASFWTPMDLVLRPAYSTDIAVQISYDSLPTYSDMSYAVADPSSGGAGFKWQDCNDTTYSGDGGFGDFALNNEAKTTYPWTAMGYTYNWNFLEDGLNGRADDTNRVSSYVGVSEFVVSAGARVEFDSFVENDVLYAYLIPESDTLTLLVFSSGLVLLRRRHCSV
jgi:hypothetical protein